MRPKLTPPLPSDRDRAAIAYTAVLIGASRKLDLAPPGDRRAHREFGATMHRAREALALDRRRN